MIPFLKTRPPAALIGLKLERSRLEGVLLRRSSGSLQAQRSFQATLSLDPLTNDPELVGREIRNHLNEAGIRERRCAVCLPLSWALTVQTKVPELPEADVASFLQIEAERGFPYAPEDLSITWSRYRAPGGEQFATIVAIPKNHLNLLERALKAAQLKPVSFSLAISALQTTAKDGTTGAAALLVGENSLELQVSVGEGVVALRSLEGAVETEGNQKRIDADVVAREIKITLGQMPRALSEIVRKLQVFGRTEVILPFLKEIRARAGGLGLDVETGPTPQINGFRLPVSAEKPVSPELSMAARHILGYLPNFEFLPPRVSPAAQFLARFSTRKLGGVGAAVILVVLVVATAFLVQYGRLASLRSQWRAVAPRVTELDNLQQRIRKFRPWFDESHRALSILRKLVEAFPEAGSDVSAKSVEIKDLSVVSCSGTARDIQALQRMMDLLRANKDVRDLKIDQTRGKAPLQFSINFRLVEQGSYEN